MMAANELTKAKRLGELIELDDARLAAITVTGIALDSREVAAGSVFLAYKGALADGRKFIEQAIASGAVAVLAERDEVFSATQMHGAVPVIAVTGLSRRLSEISGTFYGNPSSQLPVMAVTGTNGKTSCTHLAQQLLNALNRSVAVIGTLGCGVDGQLGSTINTTPDAVSIQQNLAQWRDQGVDLVTMEASSHGLAQGRLAALQIDLALFTNLTRDHLDYHGSMQAYADAKAALFSNKGLKTAVLNADDAFSNTLQAVIDSSVQVLRYSVRAGDLADVWVEDVVFHDTGVKATLHSPWGKAEINSPLLGAFNLSNLVAVITSLSALGYSFLDLVSKVGSLQTVAGRMERVATEQPLTVVVDYAHTPDALEQSLVALRHHCEGQLWCVFGCGGDRDQGKRALMGSVAQQFADHVVVTSDNPRSENPDSIINDILATIDLPSLVEIDRAKAIGFAIAQAAPGDCVLIAGKGHEGYQEVAGSKLPFSDVKQARLALRKRSESSASASGSESS